MYAQAKRSHRSRRPRRTGLQRPGGLDAGAGGTSAGAAHNVARMTAFRRVDFSVDFLSSALTYKTIRGKIVGNIHEQIHEQIHDKIHESFFHGHVHAECPGPGGLGIPGPEIWCVADMSCGGDVGRPIRRCHCEARTVCLLLQVAHGALGAGARDISSSVVLWVAVVVEPRARGRPGPSPDVGSGRQPGDRGRAANHWGGPSWGVLHFHCYGPWRAPSPLRVCFNCSRGRVGNFSARNTCEPRGLSA